MNTDEYGWRQAQVVAAADVRTSSLFVHMEPPQGRVVQITRKGWKRPKAVLKPTHSQRHPTPNASRLPAVNEPRGAFGVRASSAPLFARPARARFGQAALTSAATLNRLSESVSIRVHPWLINFLEIQTHHRVRRRRLRR